MSGTDGCSRTVIIRYHPVNLSKLGLFTIDLQNGNVKYRVVHNIPQTSHLSKSECGPQNASVTTVLLGLSQTVEIIGS